MSDTRLQVEYLPIDKLLPYARNMNAHSDEHVAELAASIKEFGWTVPVLIDKDTVLVAGHGRVLAARKLGIDQIPCIRRDHWSDNQVKAYRIADNRLPRNAEVNTQMLALELQDLAAADFELGLLGYEQAELEALLALEADPETGSGSGDGSPRLGSLAERFGVPPFSVLDARQGYWQDRKRGWLAIGIKSEEGRKGNLLGMSNTVLEPDPEKRKKLEATPEGEGAAASSAGTSIFDPVLCELAYKWFSPEGGTALDPFAGGSVRGVVCSKLGRQYVGVELREEQVAANRGQADELCQDPMPAWHCGDSANLGRICEGVQADLVFSCPPYADLEVYSDDPRDISNMPYEQFLASYRAIIAQAIALLKPNRFAVWVIGEVRAKDKAGFYRGFVPDTIRAFEDAGADFYNEAILVTSVGTLPLRAGKMFTASRKLGKTHQNVLVFCKGDPVAAAQACGQVEFKLPDDDFGEEMA